MVERSVRGDEKEGDLAANLPRNRLRNLLRNQVKVGEEGEGEVGEAQEEDLLRNLTVAEEDMVATMEK